MDEEKAINYIGKSVYIVDYGLDLVYESVVKGVEEQSTNPEYMYRLIDTKGNRLSHFFNTESEAWKDLVRFAELRVDAECKRLNEILNSEEYLQGVS